MAGARYIAKFWRERQNTLRTPAAIGRSVRRPRSAALAIAGRVPLKSRKCRGNHAGPGHGETADHLTDLGQRLLNPFLAITNAEHPTGESSLSNGKKPWAARRGVEMGYVSSPAETANQRQKVQSGRGRT
jgi:hypothetical protein